MPRKAETIEFGGSERPAHFFPTSFLRKKIVTTRKITIFKFDQARPLLDYNAAELQVVIYRAFPSKCDTTRIALFLFACPEETPPLFLIKFSRACRAFVLSLANIYRPGGRCHPVCIVREYSERLEPATCRIRVYTSADPFHVYSLCTGSFRFH